MDRRQKPGPKRKRGRPEIREKRAAKTRKQQERRSILRAYGLEKVEIWVKPGELDDLRSDAILRIAELDALSAVREGDPVEIGVTRVRLNKLRKQMGLKPLDVTNIIQHLRGAAGVRDLDAQFMPDQLERISVPELTRAAVTRTKPPISMIHPQDREEAPSYMVRDPYDPSRGY